MEARMPPTPENERYANFLGLCASSEGALHAFIRSLLPTGQMVSEVIQDVMLVLWNKFKDATAFQPRSRTPSPKSRPHLRLSCQARTLELAAGFIEIKAHKQQKDKPWRVRTPDAEAAVIGTRFTVVAKTSEPTYVSARVWSGSQALPPDGAPRSRAATALG